MYTKLLVSKLKKRESQNFICAKSKVMQGRANMTAIPISKLKEGYESAIENAERLLKAAQILNEHSCYAS